MNPLLGFRIHPSTENATARKYESVWFAPHDRQLEVAFVPCGGYRFDGLVRWR